MTEPSSYPLVSIVIPVFNGSNFLGQAIDSALAQTWPNIEVIVIDDGSEDDGKTAAIALSYGPRIRYEHKTNGGVATALNRGVSLMRGEYLSWLSHDDVYAIDKIQRMMAAVLTFAQPAVAFGDYALMDDAGTPIRTVEWKDTFDFRQPVWAVLEGRINGCAMIVPKACFDACGYFRPDLPGTQDYDLWFRMALLFPFLHVPGIMVYQRVHENQGSKNRRFSSETDLLFLSMFDRITEGVISSHATSEVHFYSRAKATLTNAGAAAALDRIIRNLVKREPLAVLVLDKRAFELSECANGFRSSGINLISAALPRAPGEQCNRVMLIRDSGSALPVSLVLTDDNSSFKEILGNFLDVVQGDFIWLNSSVKAMRASIDDALISLSRILAGSPDTVACLPTYLDRQLHPAPLRVLEGAVIRAQALRTALEQSTGSVSSLVHALTRLGIVTQNVIAGASSSETTQSVAQPPNGVARVVLESPLPPPVELTPVVRLFAWLNRSASRSRVITAALWRLLGGGPNARKCLLGWNGLQGWFDSEWYRERYSDVAAAGLDPTYHYLMFGLHEGRDPSAVFCATNYLNDHSDVAGARVPALQQYALWGRHEGRVLRPAVRALSSIPCSSKDGRPSVLILLSRAADDAVARFANDLAEQVAPRLRVLYLFGRDDRTIAFGDHLEFRERNIYELPGGLIALRDALTSFDIRRVLLLQSEGFAGHLRLLLETLALPVDVVHLDYNLAGNDQPNGEEKYCNDPSRRIADPEREWVLQHAVRHFAPSEDCAQRLRQMRLAGPVTVAPPPDPFRLRGFRVWGRSVIQSEPLRIALFGPLTEDTGAIAVRELSILIRNQLLPLSFLHFSPVDDALHRQFPELITPVNAFSGSTLTVEICRYHPHLAWFPYRVAVPHGYAILDAQANGLPIVASSVGAFPELLEKRPLSWLLPVDTSSEEWLRCFLKFHREGMPTEWSIAADAPGLPNDHRRYQERLYEDVFRSARPPAK